MKIDDLKTLVELVQDNRTPCQRDGHNFQILNSATENMAYCSKCGETKKLPDSPKIGLK